MISLSIIFIFEIIYLKNIFYNKNNDNSAKVFHFYQFSSKMTRFSLEIKFDEKSRVHKVYERQRKAYVNPRISLVFFVNTNDFQSNKSPVSYQDFTLDFYFRQFWTDPRLAFKQRTGVETLSVGSEFIKNIWVPDTFFVNEKQSYFHIATTSNEFIRIHHSGSITRSIRWV